MSKAFKFRYVNEIVGVFVAVVLAALIGGILAAGALQRWFEPVRGLRITFPREESFGLQKGAEVEMLGTAVGSVEEITVDDAGAMVGRIRMKGNFFQFVRTDSRVLAKKKFVVAGDAYIEITRGSGPPLEGGDASLPCVKDTEIMESAEALVAQLKDAVLPLVERVERALEEYTKLAADLRDPTGHLQRFLGHLETIAEGLAKGEGSVEQVLRDPALANEMKGIVVKVNASLAEVERILADIRAATATLPALSDTLGQEVKDVPGMVLQLQETLRETETLIAGIKRHWLLRRYIVQPAPGDMIPPSQVLGAGEGKP